MVLWARGRKMSKDKVQHNSWYMRWVGRGKKKGILSSCLRLEKLLVLVTLEMLCVKCVRIPWSSNYNLKASFSTYLTCWKSQAVPPSPSLTGEEDGSVEWALQLGCARNGRQWIQIPVTCREKWISPPVLLCKVGKGQWVGWGVTPFKCYCLAICPRGHLFCLWKKCWHNLFGAGLWNNGLMVHWSIATAK